MESVIALTLFLIVQASPAPLQRQAPESAKFAYLLPEGFAGWMCMDFGVDGALPLNLRDDGTYLVEPEENRRIIATSSLPHLNSAPWPNEVLRIADGRPRPIDTSLHIPSTYRGETDTKNPISRHCFFFGTSEEAHKARRPPTLYESRMPLGPSVPEKFEFVRGQLCDFRDQAPLCLRASRSDRREIVARAGKAGLELGAPSVRHGCDYSFEGVQIRYETGRSVETHSTARRAPFGFGEVRRESPKGNVALVTWMDTDGGTAKDLAGRFGVNLAEFFAEAGRAACTPGGR